MGPGVDITVLNNSSTCDYNSVYEYCLQVGARYHLSASNVVFNGNYCRAVCSGAGEYIWVISDDDLVHPVAFNLVYSLINSRERPDLISF